MRRSLLIGVALAALLAIGTGAVVQLTHALSGPEQESVNARFMLRGTQHAQSFAVVAIDDVTFSDLRQRWPFPRSLHAAVIDRLHAAGAREIVYDVQFTEPTAAREDLALYDAIGRAGGAVLATTEVSRSGHSNVLGGDANLARIHAVAAAANVISSGGVISRFPYALHGLRSIGVVAAARASGRQIARSRFGSAGALIDYAGRPNTIPQLSFSRVLEGRFDPRAVRGKIVVVGATAPTLKDLAYTPTSGHELMSGAEIQANAIRTALDGAPLSPSSTLVDLLLVALLGGLPSLLRLRLHVLSAQLTAIGAAVLYAIAVQLAFDSGLVLPFTGPLLALVLGVVGVVVASHLLETRLRLRVARDNELLEQRVRERTKQLRESQRETAQRLGAAVEYRDRDTGAHIERIAGLVYRLGLASGLSRDDAELLRDASALHDVGKVGIPDAVLHEPGELSPEQWEIMKTHTTSGAAMLAGSRSPLLQTAEIVALTHHERWDGSGYPRGLRGEQIPLAGRICAICDVYDALRSARPYKEAWSGEQARDYISAQSGRHFDPRLVPLFLTLVGEPPPPGAAPGAAAATHAPPAQAQDPPPAARTAAPASAGRTPRRPGDPSPAPAGDPVREPLATL